ncbi:cell envelope integrity protein TolA [Pantoea sp. Aalb]|uniref:cell envelope integrity protein TolA n=1 Tax=Pantoea sp. Aalb TaxID=2576762 RepID=UPI0013239C80|nr:cell envelope integrity protein TolA [Pantoea sp. Aalb]MXP67528.1 cell envelope integrity protein TolA [Pantoea sp. Aalb]
MSQIIKQKNGIKNAIIISIFFHIILIILLTWSTFSKKNILNERNRDSIDAVSIDISSLDNKYYFHQKQKKNNNIIKKQNLNFITKSIIDAKINKEKKVTKVNKEVAITSKSIIDAKINKEKKVTKVNKEVAITSKSIIDAKINKEKKVTKVNKEVAITSKSIIDAKINKEKKVTKVNKEVAITSKSIIDANKKKNFSFKQEKNKKTVNDLIHELSSSKDILKDIYNDKKYSNISIEINTYLREITKAIQEHFYDSDLYRGKSCNLRIQISPDGLLINIKSERGNIALCQAAITAAKQAQIPKPPSIAIYKIFKNIQIHFEPKSTVTKLLK